MILKEIIFEKNERSSARKAIEKALGNQVILYDFHNHWVHGFLFRDDEGRDDKCYLIDIQDGRERRQLWYHDLQTLILMKSHSGYNLPDRVAH